MTIFVPGWLQGGSYSAQHDRINSHASMWDEGVASRLDLKVVQRGAGANMSVDVGTGSCVVQGDDQLNQGNYDVFNDAVFNVTGFTVPGAGTSRYDIVGVQVNDPNAGGVGTPANTATIIRVAGTAAASPVIPALPNTFLPLAVIGPILPATTTITNSMIHTAHTGTGPTGTSAIGLCKGFRAIPGETRETYNPVAPNGWLIEDGSAISRTTFARLFEHFGVVFGVGNGSTTFNIPDSRGRVAVALDNQGANGDGGRLTVTNALGGVGGEELHTLTAAELAAHQHAGTSGNELAVHGHTGVTGNPSTPHQHSYQPNSNGVLVSGPGPVAAAAPSSTTLTGNDTPNHTHAFSTGAETATHAHDFLTNNNAPNGSAHNNMPPYILLYRIVRT